MALTVPTARKALRHRNLDDNPTKFEVDPLFNVQPYQACFMEPGKGGIIRAASTYDDVDLAATHFVGFTEDRVLHGSIQDHVYAMVMKTFERDVDLIASPTNPVTMANFDPLVTNFWICLWLDPDGFDTGVPAVSDKLFDLESLPKATAAPLNAIGLVKNLCAEFSHREQPLCPGDQIAPDNTSATVPAAGACGIKTVYGHFESRLLPERTWA